MIAAAKRAPVSEADFAKRCEVDPEPRFLWDGEVFPIEAVSIVHARLADQIFSLLRGALEGRPCRAHSNGTQVWIPGKHGIVAPDVVVACPPSGARPTPPRRSQSHV